MDVLRAEILTAAQAEAFEGAWQDLADRALDPTVFSEPSFLLPAMRHLPGGRNVRLIVVWQGPAERSRLVGLCAVKSGILHGRVLPAAAWLHTQATAAFPLLDRDAAALALPVLVTKAGDLPGHPSAIVFHGVAADGPTAALLAALPGGVRELDSRQRAVLPHDSEAIAPSGKSGKELRRQAKRLAEQGAVGFKSIRDDESMTAAVADFLMLEARGWKGRRGSAFSTRPGLAAFARDALVRMAQRGLCRIDRLTLDRRTIAAGIVLRSGPHGFFWKTAYDETLARFSPGVQLVLRLSDAQRGWRGVTQTDSCAVPGHSMIDRLWRARITVLDVTVMVDRRRRATFEAATTLDRLRRSARAAVKRHAGRLLPRTKLPRRP